MGDYNETDRNSNLEILRIISMILIVMSHSDDWTGLTGIYTNVVCLNKFIMDWLHLGGQIGVGCFLLISGYFMVDKQISLKKILRLCGEIWFYTVSIWLIFFIASVLSESVNLMNMLKQGILAFFPILLSHYWFVTAYMILMILSPFFNRLISAMDKCIYQYFLLALIILFVVIDGGVPKLLSGMSEGRLIPVFIMYFIAGYIKKYVVVKKDNALKHIASSFFIYFLLYASVVAIDIIGDIFNSQTIISKCYFWRPLNSPFVVAICVELFLGFLMLPLKKNKGINIVAKSTFGIYLLHCNNIIYTYVLPRIFPVYKETNPLFVLIYSICSVITVFVVCSLIDIARSKTIERLWIRFLDKNINDMERKIKYALKQLNNIFWQSRQSD